MRRFASAAVVVLFAGILLAGEYKGVVTSIDTEAKTIELKSKADKKTVKVKYDDKTEFTKVMKDKESKADVAKAAAMLKEKGKGPFAEITTEGEGDKEVATKVMFKLKGKKDKDK